jgi:hypothetical protein
MILLRQAYRSPDAFRQAELDAVREANARVAAFTNVVDVDGAARRWTFADFFRLAAERFPGQVCVLANSDIAFDDSVAQAGPLAERGMLLALSRWDDGSAPSMEGRVAGSAWRFFSHSQDVWIFKAGGLPAFEAGFHLGIPQCESRLAYEAAAAGVVVVNPALSIVCHHHHASAVRSWRRREGYRGAMLFPRLTTTAIEAPEALVVLRPGRFRKVQAVVAMTGSAADFHRRLAENSRAEAVTLAAIGIRSPFYIRRKSP